MTIDLIGQARAKLRRAKIAEDTRQAALLDLRDRLAAGDIHITRETVQPPAYETAITTLTRAETERRLQGELDAMLAEKSDQERIAHLQSDLRHRRCRGGTMRDRTPTWSADRRPTPPTRAHRTRPRSCRDLFGVRTSQAI